MLGYKSNLEKRIFPHQFASYNGPWSVGFISDQFFLSRIVHQLVGKQRVFRVHSILFFDILLKMN